MASNAPASQLPDQPMTVPKLPHRASAYAARRPPAHKSVSLRQSRSPPSKHQSRDLSILPSSAAPHSDVATISPFSVQLAKGQQHSSGESSDAGKWFDRSNKDVNHSNDFGPDNDPPFFLRNSSSSETPPEHAPAHVYPFPNAQHLYKGQAPLPTEGSSDDFRSVIDDLTIANKKLKRKLRRYERMHDSHMQDEKLFEVRFHGLSAHRKRELEETLKKFAMGNDDGSTPDTNAESATTGTGVGTGTGAGATSATTQHYPSVLRPGKAAGSSNTSRFAESGYASASGQGNSSAPSGKDSTHAANAARPVFNRNDSEIQSYLHDIPAGLMPQGNPMAMTEKARKKLVVRRLEQIFAGQGPVGHHHQPIQQQEVSQSAAHADRQDLEASGQGWQKEGIREAKIMQASNDTNMDSESSPKDEQSVGAVAKVQQMDFAPVTSPDQRPTRPLDLDPHRAQVPAENFDYIRHLGFTPPSTMHSPIEGRGWLYLNLVINMAQLHTINVTVDFVKKAVEDYSSKLELSRDGRKIRWRGGQDITRNSSDTSSERQGADSPELTLDGDRSKRQKVTTTGASAAQAQERAFNEQKYRYTPIFFRKEESTSDESDSPRDPSSLSSVAPAQNSSGFTSSGMHTNVSKRRRDGGPVIFYNKAKFCTDLSGDSDQPGQLGGTTSAYEAITRRPVGGQAGDSDAPDQMAERRDITGAFRNVVDDVEMRDVSTGDTSASDSSDFHFSLKSLERNNSRTSAESPNHSFEASGLGGVQPTDNFAIHVVSQRNQDDAPHATAPIDIHHTLRTILATQKPKPTRPAFTETILSTTTRNLPASTLPAPSFLPFDSSSADADSSMSPTSDADMSSLNSSSAVSSDDAHSDAGQPTTTRQPLFNIHDHASSSGAESDPDGTSGSVDFLALARAVDPQSVRAREREYDANLAERLAEDIPAGSSAATAGGGSGFNSPASEDGKGGKGGKGVVLS